MAERSRAAVGVTHGGATSKPPPAHEADEVTDDGGTAKSDGPDTAQLAQEGTATAKPAAPELHSGHKIAKRYRLEECVTRLDGFSSWRAVDEKLRRAVGVHILPAGHPRARRVLAAARSAALLGDPRFVQVLDAVEGDELVYVVHEWLPDSTPLSELLIGGPLPAHEAYQLVAQVAQAVAAAHQEGLSHLLISPAAVLRTGSGQYRIRGLAVSAALRGVTSDHPQQADTEAIGALLYACLTQRWPYDEDAYGLSGVGTLARGTLVAPEQVRAGVHRGLSELAMRALVSDGATASRQEQPCATPEELAAAVARLPRVRPPEAHFDAPRAHPHATNRQGGYGWRGEPAAGGEGGHLTGPLGPNTPPALPGRTGAALKWGVSALLIAALGLGSWQVSETLMNREPPTDKGASQPEEETGDRPDGEPVEIVDAVDFDPQGDGSENPEVVARAYDGDPESFWYTRNYYDHPEFGRLKPGAGLILDLGKRRQVSSVKAHFEGRTSAELLVAPESTVGMPTSYGSFQHVTENTGPDLTYGAEEPLTTQYVLIWLTELPQATDGNYRGRITEIQVTG
ncbi:hypothetical protein N566_12895 [Streptomycetaceae bacterium MP113-05]|nr:hypothetical protein N566_12895 [Streptomycetaceae bacterium MP113-05]